jgi:tetratricopeptide (TPR) repeat protein
MPHSEQVDMPEGHASAQCNMKVRNRLSGIHRSSIGILLSALVGIPLVVGVLIRQPDSSLSEPKAVAPPVHQLEPEVRRLVEKQSARVRTRPDNAAGHGELGLIFEANRLWSAAQESFERAVQLDSPNQHWRFHLAVASYENGDFAAAVEILKSLAQENPSSAPVQQRLGHALLQNESLDEARLAFERVVQAAPKEPAGYVGLADVHLRQGDLQQAGELLRQALALDPNYRVTHFMLGTVYQRQGRTDEAVRELALGERAELRYLPDPLAPRVERYAVNLNSRLNRAVQRMATGDHAGAARILEAALQTDPDNTTILNNLAGAYVQTGRIQEAHQLLLQALRVDGRKYTTYLNLASWNLQFGRKAEALKYAEGAIERAPWVPAVQRIRLEILLRMDRVAEAQIAVDEARRIMPRDPYIEQMSARLRQASPVNTKK